VVTSPAAALRLAGWSAFLAGTLRLLHGPAFGVLSPPLTSVAELGAWIERTSPTVMALALVRLGALAATWYLVAATVVLVVADVAGWRRIAAVVAAASPRVVRHIASRGAGVGLSVGVLVAAAPLPHRLAAAPAGADPGPTGGPVARPLAVHLLADDGAPLRLLPDDEPDTAVPPPTATMHRIPNDEPPTATMHRVPDDRAPQPPAPSEPPPGPAGPAADVTGGGVEVETWTVATGDSFWSIAEQTLAGPGAAADDRRIAVHWRRLVEANRDRLPDPANPDLLLPGQELVLLPPA
jgi:hypothetical protein